MMKFNIYQGMIAVIFMATVSAAWAASIGTVTQTRGAAWIESDSGADRQAAEKGSPVQVNDVIETGPNSALKFKLLDGAKFSLGQNSRLVINEFVWDAKTRKGRIVVTLIKGALSVSSGNIDSGSIIVNTPHGVITGEDSTTFTVVVAEPGHPSLVPGTHVFNEGGNVSLTDENGTVVIPVDGTGFMQDGDGEPPAIEINAPDITDQLTSEFPRIEPGPVFSQRPLPTIVPTLAPTLGPTPNPTAAPTAVASPTPVVTVNPTPTINPTIAPSPSTSPTIAPSASPTVAPSASPTIAPTPTPTPAPTTTPEPPASPLGPLQTLLDLLGL